MGNQDYVHTRVIKKVCVNGKCKETQVETMCVNGKCKIVTDKGEAAISVKNGKIKVNKIKKGKKK